MLELTKDKQATASFTPPPPPPPPPRKTNKINIL